MKLHKFEKRLIAFVCILGIGLPALACIYAEYMASQRGSTCCPTFAHVDLIDIRPVEEIVRDYEPITEGTSVPAELGNV